MNIEAQITVHLDEIVENCSEETDREELIELLDEATDDIWGNLVQYGRIDEYTVDDLIATASDCAEIVMFAKEHSWVEDDHGLWEGLNYGALASIAYFSLRNCLYSLLEKRGIDSNNDHPFEVTV